MSELYQYGGKVFDRRNELRQVLAQLDSIEQVVAVPYLERGEWSALVPRTLFWDDLFDGPPVPAAAGSMRSAWSGGSVNSSALASALSVVENDAILLV